jgi:hypothetical protein
MTRLRRRSEKTCAGFTDGAAGREGRGANPALSDTVVLAVHVNAYVGRNNGDHHHARQRRDGISMLDCGVLIKVLTAFVWRVPTNSRGLVGRA